MNWRLIFQLSLFALAMGIATVFVIPSNIEPFFWLAIMLVSAYLIARRAGGRYFLHGLALGIANCFWVIAAHVGLFPSYVARHPEEMGMMATMPLPTHPRLMMVLTGLVIGVVSGIVIGLLSLLASRMVSPAPPLPRSAGAVP
ncbi:MAG: hypothetical protein ACJ79K_15020 [Gemmatimonadaceae bacterium]